MHFAFPVRRALGAALAASFIGGCAGGGSQFSPSPNVAERLSGTARTQPAACPNTGPLLYVSLGNPKIVNIYPNPLLPTSFNPPPCATITQTQGLNLPEGLAVHGNKLYVANLGSENVLVFNKNGAGVPTVLNDKPYAPGDVAVAKNGTVYVSNDFNSPGGTAVITVFPPNSTTYTSTLTDVNASSGVGIAIDSKGNCFWSYDDFSNHGQVDEFTSCTGSGVQLALVKHPINPGGLVMGPRDDMILIDQAGPAVYRIAPPYNAAPVSFPTTGLGVPFYVTLRSGASRLYVADPGVGWVQRYENPFGTPTVLPPLSTGLAPGEPLGVAVWPAARL